MAMMDSRRPGLGYGKRKRPQTAGHDNPHPAPTHQSDSAPPKVGGRASAAARATLVSGITKPWTSGLDDPEREARSSSTTRRTNLIWRVSCLVRCGSRAADVRPICSAIKVAQPASRAASMESGTSERRESLIEPVPIRCRIARRPTSTSSGPLCGGWGRSATPETRQGVARPSVQEDGYGGHGSRSQPPGTRVPSQLCMSPAPVRLIRRNSQESGGIGVVISLRGGLDAAFRGPP
jgi:hypothetical protein